MRCLPSLYQSFLQNNQSRLQPDILFARRWLLLLQAKYGSCCQLGLPKFVWNSVSLQDGSIKQKWPPVA